MWKRVRLGTLVVAAIVLAVTLLWSLWEWRRVSRIILDLAKAETMQYDISLPPGLFAASTTLGASRRIASDKTQIILVGSSDSPLTVQSTPRWEQFLHALGAYELTVITFDRVEVFDRILQMTRRIGHKPEVLTITDPATFVLTTGINSVPFTIVAAPTGEVIGLVAGVPTDAILNRVSQQLGGIERRTVVGLGPGDIP
ncbi:MAG TPA: hypothetical protein PLA43_20380 [Bryobacteraceae bacterium]|mgnify:CR=1 FL=1|jgi:hypothetical protein|nr:hypothetical protein [Bryobacteraceae bacterium]